LFEKASPNELDSALYLPSLTDEMEYMTTKKANNKVMKSANDTIQRSWLLVFTGSFLLRLAMA
jgi:hypothetical protein